MGLDQFYLSAFWQNIGVKRRLRAIWASGSDCRLPLQRRIGTRRDQHPCVWFRAVRRSSEQSTVPLEGRFLQMFTEQSNEAVFLHDKPPARWATLRIFNSRYASSSSAPWAES